MTTEERQRVYDTADRIAADHEAEAEREREAAADAYEEAMIRVSLLEDELKEWQRKADAARRHLHNVDPRYR
jgi:hypothetical protein